MADVSLGNGDGAAGPMPGGTRLVNHAISGRSPSSIALAAHAARHEDWGVSGVQLFRRDAVVRKFNPFAQDVVRSVGAPRGVITEFSDRSRYRLLFFVKNCDANFHSMMTLTYPKEFPGDGLIVKGHLRALKKRLVRRWPAFRAVWFLEFQRRGAPHYHLLCETDLASMGDPVWKLSKSRKGGGYWTVPAYEDWLSASWFDVVDSGDVLHLQAGSSWEIIREEEGALRYAATHAAKPHQKKVPEKYQNVGAFWRWIGNLTVEQMGEVRCDTETVFEAYGHEALSSRGRVRKYLFDGANKFTNEGSL